MNNYFCLLFFTALSSVISYCYSPIVSNPRIRLDYYLHSSKDYLSLNEGPSLTLIDERPKLNPPTNDRLATTETAVVSPNSISSGQLSKWNARALLLLVAALYGTNCVCVKILGQSIEPSVAGLEVGLYSFLGYATQAAALQTTKASTAAFLCALVVVAVPLLDLFAHTFVVNKNNKAVQATDSSTNSGNAIPSPFFALFPALLAATGVGFLELAGDDIPGVGDLLALGQPVFFGLAFWRAEQVTRNFPEADDTKVFSGASMASVSLGSLCWAYVDYLRPLLAQGSEVAMQSLHAHMALFSDWHIPAALIWTGVVTTGFTTYGENLAMKTLSAAELTVLFSTEPLWGTAFAALVLGEKIGGNVIIGAILILASCIWSGLGPSVTTAGAATTAGVLATVVEGAEGVDLIGNIAMNWEKVVTYVEELLLTWQGTS